MSTSELSIEYRCSNDCRMEGCPGHTGKLSYQSTSDAYSFDMGGFKIHFERGELGAVLKLIAELAEYRYDAVQPLEVMSEHLKRRDYVAPRDLYNLLPSTYYMDPPDGGNVSLLEQLQRMAEDAAKYRDLCK